MEMTLRGWTFDVDEEATRRWYATAEDWGCTCGHCRNYLAQSDTALPEEIGAFLDRVGVDRKKAGYVCQCAKEETGHLYQVQYPIVGRVLREGVQERDLLVLLPGQRMEPDGAEGFPEPRFEVECWVRLPWVLKEPESGPHHILISSELEEDTSSVEEMLKTVIPAALAAEGVNTPCELDVLLTDDQGIHQINLDMREVDRPTDVLSFPMFDYVPGEPPVDDADADPESGLTPLGDMVLSLERARAQAAEFGHSVEREIAYLSVHSVLHLLGYDHMDEGPMKAQMRAREEEILRELGITREE